MSTFKLGDLVRKKQGSEWEGWICGTYSTALTPEGYAVESSTHAGSVQIYPAAALVKDTYSVVFDFGPAYHKPEPFVATIIT